MTARGTVHEALAGAVNNADTSERSATNATHVISAHATRVVVPRAKAFRESTLVTRLLDDGELRDWDAFVASATTGSVYSRAEYLKVLCSAGGGHFRVLVAEQAGRLLGGVALYDRNFAFGAYVSPRLLLYYNGPVVRASESTYPSERTAHSLKTLSTLESALRGMGYGSIKLRPRSEAGDIRPFLANGWKSSPGFTYVVDVRDLSATRSRIEPNLRRLIDRCARTRFLFTDDDDFESFFALHAATMGRIGVATYLPQERFRLYFEQLRRANLARLFHARADDGTVVSSQLVLLGHEVTHTVAAATEAAHLKTGVTAFLRWKVFEWLSREGYVANDLTDASLNSVSHFKAQLGGELLPLHELHAPETTWFAVGTRLHRLSNRGRSLAGSVLRRIR